MSTLTGSEQRLEILNQVLSENQKLMQRWDERLHLGNLKIATRWLAGTVIFAFKIARKNSEEVNWLICYCPSEPRPREGYSAEKVLVGQNEELTVFVNDIQVVNHPQRFVSTFIRPEFINGLLGLGGHACYFSRLNGFVIRQRPSDWESAALGWLPSLPVGEVPRQMIQGGTEIMDGIASTTDHVNMECPSGVRPRQITLRIYEERCDIRADFGGEPLHLEDVLFGPFGLYSNLR